MYYADTILGITDLKYESVKTWCSTILSVLYIIREQAVQEEAHQSS